ncbi:MAG: hypothetical protein WAP51_03375, partial [Candidatus Sungiibacteriota bacterium]
PAIAGGDDSPVPPETCQRHRGCRLQSLFDNELREKFNVLQIWYCPLLECDFVKLHGFRVSPGEVLIDFVDKKVKEMVVLTAARQKAFFKKFAEQFVGNGK